MTLKLDTVSTTTGWFDAWLAAFGTEGDGIWVPPDKPDDLGIPYVKGQYTVGAIRIPMATGATNDHTPRYDILGELSQPAYALQAMMKECGVSLLSFSYLSENSRLLRAIRKNDAGLLYYVDFCETSPYVDCTVSWEEYWHSRGKTKATWKRRERKLFNDRHAQFECVTEWGRAEFILPEVFAIEASGWKGQAGSAIQQDRSTLAFYTTIARQWADDGALRLFILSIDQQIVAFQLNALYGGVLYHVKVGYLEEYAALSPGQALQLRILRWAFDNPDIQAFDMLGGGGRAAENKLKWATHAETLHTLYVFRKDLCGLIAWARLVLAPASKARLLGKEPKGPEPLPHPLKTKRSPG